MIITVLLIFIILLLIVLFLTYKKAIEYTNQHHKTIMELKQVKVNLFNSRCEIGELKYRLENAQQEIDKWKQKSLEISIYAQKISL